MKNYGRTTVNTLGAEKILLDLVEKGVFDEFFSENGIPLSVINEDEVKCAEAYSLGVDYEEDIEDCDIELSYFENDDFTEFVRAKEGEYLLCGCGVVTDDLENADCLLAHFIFSNKKSDTLLAVGFAIQSDNFPEGTGDIVKFAFLTEDSYELN